jgi:hypothetical protein
MDQFEARDHETDHAFAVAIARSRLGMQGSKWHDVDQRLARAVLRLEDGHDAIRGAKSGGSSPAVRQPESDLHVQVDAVDAVDPARTAAQHGVVVNQPPPIVTDLRPTWEVVIAHVEQLQRDGAHAYLCVDEDVLPLVLSDMRAHEALGRAVYGTPLTAGNGRDHLIDAYQELLDGCVYLMNELVVRHVPLTGRLTEEKVPDWPERSYQQDVRALCLLQIRSAIQLRALIKSRTELSVASQQWRAASSYGSAGLYAASVLANRVEGFVGPDIAPGNRGSARCKIPISPEVLRGLQLINRHLTDSGHDWRAGTDMADVHVAQQWLANTRLAETDPDLDQPLPVSPVLDRNAPPGGTL